MSWIDQIREGLTDIFHSIETAVCENTGFACNTDLSKNLEKADKVDLKKLPHVELKEITSEREQVVGCYIQMHQVGCYETMIQSHLADPKKLQETLEKAERESHGEMIIMPSKRFKRLIDSKMVEKMVEKYLRDHLPAPSAPASPKGNLPPPGCRPGTVGP